jgi:ribosome maturation protein SDO1
VRLTNVALVKLKRGGKRFEIACYKNKVVNWRNGVEPDLDEVLQIDSVFANVSRGILAKASDLQQCFGTTDKMEVCQFILRKGQLQVSDKERQVANEILFRDIAAIVSEKCVNSETRRPFTVNMIEKTMKNTLHYAAKSNKTAKKQALDVIKLLQPIIPIVRALLRVRISVPCANENNTKNELMGAKYQVNHIKTVSAIGAELSVFDCNIQPGDFRALDDFIRGSGVGGQGLEVMDMHGKDEGRDFHSTNEATCAKYRPIMLSTKAEVWAMELSGGITKIKPTAHIPTKNEKLAKLMKKREHREV